MVQKIKIIKQAGLRNTSHHLVMLRYLSRKNKPLFADTILQDLRKSGININQATVYRILERFEKKRLIKKINFYEGKFRYELAGEHHHHLVCKKCDSVKPVTLSDDLKKEEVRIYKLKKFKVTSHNLEFFGLCRHCS